MRSGSENRTKEKQVVVYRLNGELYGIDIEQTIEIIRLLDITPVPRTPGFVEGVINLRGKVIPVIDLRKRFLMSEAEKNSEQRIIIVELGEMVVGMIVDAVSEVLTISENKIEDAPSMFSMDVRSGYIEGIANLDEKLIILVDLVKIFDRNEYSSLEEAVNSGQCEEPAAEEA